jgi:hypothetical protein
MAIATQDPWQTGRPWQIVRADLDLAHVFLPLSSFTFEPATSTDGISGYTIAHTNQSPEPDCFAGSFLRPVGTSQPKFETITNKTSLPLYDKTSASEYADVSAQMAAYMEQDPEVRRLEGVIKVPCHAHGAVLASDVIPGHPPMWIKTIIHIYQFSDVVNGDHPLLLLRAPLSPLCPANGGGTAIGLS